MDILRHAARSEAQLPVCIRVFVSGWAQAEANGEYGDLEAGSESGPASSKAGSHGDWGFFLVEKAVDPAWSSQEDAHHTVDLFLYREGDAPA
jgi:hypothetical protein